ncbi:hypothetical protein GCM10027258_49830 [Amycolatopsis stemonae]
MSARPSARKPPARPAADRSRTPLPSHVRATTVATATEPHDAGAADTPSDEEAGRTFLQELRDALPPALLTALPQMPVSLLFVVYSQAKASVDTETLRRTERPARRARHTAPSARIGL